MNNEIKEILNNLKYVSNDIKVHIKDGYIIREEIPSSIPKELRLDSYSAKVLLNYITNLQQKVEQYENPDDLTLFYMWLDEKAKDKMKELQKENERLKDELEKEFEGK